MHGGAFSKRGHHPYLKNPPESTDRSSFTSSTYRMDLSISSSACAHAHSLHSAATQKCMPSRWYLHAHVVEEEVLEGLVGVLHNGLHHKNTNAPVRMPQGLCREGGGR